MRKSLIIIMAGLLLAAVVFMVFRRETASPPLAVYQGKTAEEWLGEVFTTNQAAALQAFRTMGTNALPAVVNGFRRRDYPWTKFYRGLYPKLPARLAGFLPRPVPKENIWSAAQLVLLNMPGAQKVAPALWQLLRRKENPARDYILNAAANVSFDGNQSEEIVPIVSPFLQDTNAGVRMSAVRCLGQLGPAAKTAIPALTRSLKDSDIGVRVNAARALWQIDPHADGVTTALTDAMNSLQNSIWTKWAAVHLHEINPDDVSLIPVFVGMLNGSDPGMRLSSAAILGQYGRAAGAAVPGLENAIRSSFPELRARAVSSLKRIDPDAAAKYEQR